MVNGVSLILLLLPPPPPTPFFYKNWELDLGIVDALWQVSSPFYPWTTSYGSSIKGIWSIVRLTFLKLSLHRAMLIGLP